ncbi:MAG: ABC transporter substrate-binding protein [Cyanobacteria bacterium P01_F01_bin.150]
MMNRRLLDRLSLSVLASLAVAGCATTAGETELSTAPTAGETEPSTATVESDTEQLTIWWQDGFYPEEIDALNNIIKDWEEDRSLTVDLTVIPQKDILQEVERAIADGTQPDILYAGVGDITIFPRLAWEGQLADVSDVIEPLSDRYAESALAGVNYQNKQREERNYYAVPLMQSAIHIHFWEDLLINRVGERRDTIPKTWDTFWQFWVNAQSSLDQAEGTNIKSVGMPMSLSLDTYNNFEQFLEAYDVQVLDADGNLTLDTPEMRDAFVAALADYANFYKLDTVPADATDWDNTGNNVSLLSRDSLMTVNHTLSAPGSQRNDEEIYYEKLSTIKWPNKPTGEPMRFVIEIKQAVMFQNSDQPDTAKDFLSHLIQPDNLAAYTQGAQGRYLPVMPELFNDPFWQNPKDWHIEVALEQLENTRAAYQSINPAYGEVAAQNVWGNAMRKMALDNISPEQAADEAIQDIQRILTEWQ